MFKKIKPIPPDPIFGLISTYLNDKNPDKVNLTVGTFKDHEGRTPILDCVKKAEETLLSMEQTKNYLSIEGHKPYCDIVKKLLFQQVSERFVTAQTPGGTGALRLAGEFIKKLAPNATVWVSDPTWPNHLNIFRSCGFEVKSYPYYDRATQSILFDEMLGIINSSKENDVLVLHACCHNPTGMDLDKEQWQALVKQIAEKRLYIILDFAYQGFSVGLEEDAHPLRVLLDAGMEFMVANSFSKNFGLYNDRIGALTIVTESEKNADDVMTNLRHIARGLYSNPPAHGAKVIELILLNEDSYKQWVEELDEMRNHISELRRQFVLNLKKLDVLGFEYVEKQKGLFSYLNLTENQVTTLIEKYSIYLLKSGRINLAGLNRDNMDYVCDAIHQVVTSLS